MSRFLRFTVYVHVLL